MKLLCCRINKKEEEEEEDRRRGEGEVFYIRLARWRFGQTILSEYFNRLSNFHLLNLLLFPLSSSHFIRPLQMVLPYIWVENDRIE